MRLIRRLKDLEQAARRRQAAAAGAGVGIAWSSSDVRLSDEELAAAPFLAVDVWITGRIQEVLTWRTVQRASASAEDRGRVYDESGRVVGQVVSVDGRMVTWREVRTAPAPRGA